MDWLPLCQDLARAHGTPVLDGILRSSPEDFIVTETLGFEPDGKGEHLFVYMEKRDMTTHEAQRHLAAHFRVPLPQVSFAGMKDRHGITRQWFSIQHADRSQAPEALAYPRLRCLQARTNSRKLRRGSHRGNQFRIRIRNIRGDSAAAGTRLSLIQQAGVPNYFGPQRFGAGARNLAALEAWFSGNVRTPRREERSMLLSAGRSFLFNRLLSCRVSSATWNRHIEGDCMALDGSGAVFAASRATTEELEDRLQRMDIHPTGFLFGSGEDGCTASCAELEKQIAVGYPALAQGLLQQGLQLQRRPLRMPVRHLQHAFEDDTLVLEFDLPTGGFATTMLRELLAGEPA
jgi:tRNA pseudouridine13 synthase